MIWWLQYWIHRFKIWRRGYVDPPRRPYFPADIHAVTLEEFYSHIPPEGSQALWFWDE
jgi:hypothetical protein